MAERKKAAKKAATKKAPKVERVKAEPIMSPIQPGDLGVTGPGIIREIEAITQRVGEAPATEVRNQLVEYAANHPDRLSWYIQHLSERQQLLAMIMMISQMRGGMGGPIVT